MSTKLDAPKPLEFVLDNGVNSVTFSPDGSYLVIGCNDGTIQQWRISDCKTTTMKADGSVLVVAVSGDGKWIVSGGLDCKVTVWDAKTRKRAVEATWMNEKWISALDVSPGSTRFVSASSDYTANIWSLTTGQRLVGPLKHNNRIDCVVFSPDGDQVATAGLYDCLRVWDSRDGRLITEVSNLFPESLVWWRDDQILASTQSTQLWIDVLSGSTLMELPRNNDSAAKVHLAISRNRNLSASLEKHTLFLWDQTSCSWCPISSELGYAGHTIAISPDNRYLVTGGDDKVSIWDLQRFTPKNASHHLTGVFMQLNGTIIDAWSNGKLESVIEILSRNIALNGQSHHALANRALVYARLKEWDNALFDAEMSIDVQPTVIGCIAKSMALGGQGQHENSMQAFDLAFSYCDPEQLNCLLLVKAVILFLVGLHRHSIARTADLIKVLPDIPASKSLPYCIVRGHMSLLLAKSAMESHDYSHAIQLLTSAKDPGEIVDLPELLTISLIAGWNFSTLRFDMHRTRCEALFAAGLTGGAVASFLEGVHGTEVNSIEETKWASDFKRRCIDKLKELGDQASDAVAHCDALFYYSSALTLDNLSTDLLVKRSRAHTTLGNWEAAIEDANAAISLDPSRPWSYEVKHAALHGAGRYDEAIETLNQLVLKLEQSPDRHIRELRDHYANPSQTIATIRSFARQLQRDFPLVLIDTENGHLCDDEERIRVFEADPKFKQLVSSIVLHTDNNDIDRVVQEYFRYATFSHTWEGDEPLFHDVVQTSVHDLAGSPKMMKLLMFCKIVREAGFRWAWSDTCCINKTDGAALQESLTSMFQWYHESSLTVVHLKGVLSDTELGALEASLWNTRAWTLQEFFASKVIRFYTEDWKPYLPREVAFNHKKSPLIMQEMALATGIDANELLSLRPGSENVRQKLRLASTRLATKQEDVAYSLFGIFDVSIPVTYGEGQRRALGRLLQEILTRSGDSAILAWTGKASDYNSCLPAEIIVYREPLSPHLPLPIPEDEMEKVLFELQLCSTVHESAIELYDRLLFLPTPRLVSRRLSLSCIVFLLRTVSRPLVTGDNPSVRVYRATASALGEVEIRTSDNLAGLTNLVLVHPWLQPLFDPILPHEDLIADDMVSLSTHIIPDSDSIASEKHLARLSLRHVVQQLQLPSPLDKTTRALRAFARLRQPFGALLLAPHSSREYKRVATDHLIVVRIRKEVSPQYLMDKIRTLDIL